MESGGLILIPQGFNLNIHTKWIRSGCVGGWADLNETKNGRHVKKVFVQVKDLSVDFLWNPLHLLSRSVPLRWCYFIPLGVAERSSTENQNETKFPTKLKSISIQEKCSVFGEIRETSKVLLGSSGVFRSNSHSHADTDGWLGLVGAGRYR